MSYIFDDAITHPNQPVLGLELPLRRLVIVDQREACAPSTTKVCLQTERDDTLLVGLVHLGELLAELRLGDIRTRRVQDVNDELTACEEAVGDELAGPDCYRGCCVGLQEKSSEGELADIQTIAPEPHRWYIAC